MNQNSYAGVGDQLALGRSGALGFALEASDGEIWTTLSSKQQAWIAATLARLNDLIVEGTGTVCPTWGPAIPQAAGCFQSWYNASFGSQMTRPDGTPYTIRADGVFDQETLDALITVTGINPKDFPDPFPVGAASEERKLSRAHMFGIAAVGAAVVGGAVYFTQKRTPKRKTRRR